MSDENAENHFDDTRLVASGDVKFEVRNHNIIGAWKNDHYVERKDFDEDLQMRAHALIRQMVSKIGE